MPKSLFRDPGSVAISAFVHLGEIREPAMRSQYARGNRRITPGNHYAGGKSMFSKFVAAIGVVAASVVLMAPAADASTSDGQVGRAGIAMPAAPEDQLIGPFETEGDCNQARSLWHGQTSTCMDLGTIFQHQWYFVGV